MRPVGRQQPPVARTVTITTTTITQPNTAIPVVTPNSNPNFHGRVVKCMHVRGPNPCPACAQTATVQGRVLPGTRH